MRLIVKKYIKFPAFLISFCLIFISASQSAYAWDAVLGATVGNQLHWLYDSIKGAALAAVKQTAVQTLNTTVNNMVGGGSSSSNALFITDWQDYLVTQPQKDAKTYMNDYFSQLSNGKSSSTYTSSEGTSSTSTGSSGNYVADMVNQVKTKFNNSSSPTPTYEGNIDNLFSDNNSNNFTKLVSNPMNLEIGVELDAQQKYDDAINNAKEEATTKAIAYNGFKAKESNGKVITPGSTIKDMTSNVQDLGNKVIASANNIPEVMTSIVTKMVTQSIQQGIGNIQSNLQKEINSATSKVSSAVSSSAKSSGISVYYSSSSSSNSNSNSSSGSTISSSASNNKTTNNN